MSIALQRRLVVGTLTAALGLCVGCGRTPSMQEAQGSIQPSSPSPTVTTLAPSPGPPKKGENPLGMPIPIFVVGDVGLSGPSMLGSGTGLISISNNDEVVHRPSLLKLTHPMTAAQLSASISRVGRIPGARVIYPGKNLSPPSTGALKVTPLVDGSYAMIDLAIDPKTDKPFSAEAAYAWPLVVGYPEA